MNPKCPKCNSKTVCVGIGDNGTGVLIIEYKCQGKGCRVRVLQSPQGVKVG